MNGTLYLEVDEDITSAIDKLNKVEGSEVRVVVPKRSTLLSSMINLKLLKKAAGDAKKDLVLVTTDNSIINLASRVGLPVAENLKADAEVPEAAEAPATSNADVIEESDPEPQPEPEPVVASPMSVRSVPDEPAAPPAKPKKKSKVPDFNGFQKKVMTAGIVVAVIAGLFAVNFFIKRANITIFAKGSRIPTDLSFRAVEGQGDPAAGEVGATTLTKEEQLSGSFPATGEKDNGTKAKGTITIKNCEDTDSHSLPAGSRVTSSGKTFITNSAAAIPAGDFSGGGTVCNSTTVSVGVTASANGDSFNLAPANYTTPSLPTTFRITGNQMSGGTSKIIKIVSQSDITAARSKLIKQKEAEIKDSMKGEAGDKVAVEDSFSAKVANSVAAPAVGEEGDSFELTLTTTFTMLALNKGDLEELVKEEVESKLGNDNQIYDAGLADAEIKKSGSSYSLSTDVYAGAKLEVEEIKNSIKGKKLGEAGSEIGKLSGVERTEINLSPFWVTRVPRLGSSIKIEIKVAPAGE